MVNMNARSDKQIEPLQPCRPNQTPKKTVYILMRWFILSRLISHQDRQCWRDEEQIRPTWTTFMKPKAHKQREEVQRKNRLGTVSRKIIWERNLDPVLFTRNLTFNFNATPSYKYMSSTSSVKHHSEAHQSKSLWWNKAKGAMAIWSQNARKPQIGPRRAQPPILIVRNRSSETDWERSHH